MDGKWCYGGKLEGIGICFSGVEGIIMNEHQKYF